MYLIKNILASFEVFHQNFTIQHMNFNLPAFTGSNGTCAKYNWANNCKVSWDGITYGVENPCTVTTEDV